MELPVAALLYVSGRVSVTVIVPGDWRRPPAEVGWAGIVAEEAYPPAVYRAYAGRANGQDASRFSFRGQSDAASEFGWVFECQLEDDDTVSVATSKVLWPPVAGP